jgi:hypothetical protein
MKKNVNEVRDIALIYLCIINTLIACGMMGAMVTIKNEMPDLSPLRELSDETKLLLNVLGAIPWDKAYLIEDLMNRCDQNNCIDHLFNWLNKQDPIMYRLNETTGVYRP